MLAACHAEQMQADHALDDIGHLSGACRVGGGLWTCRAGESNVLPAGILDLQLHGCGGRVDVAARLW